MVCLDDAREGSTAPREPPARWDRSAPYRARPAQDVGSARLVLRTAPRAAWGRAWGRGQSFRRARPRSGAHCVPGDGGGGPAPGDRRADDVADVGIGFAVAAAPSNATGEAVPGDGVAQGRGSRRGGRLRCRSDPPMTPG